jgi:hypothetical protein
MKAILAVNDSFDLVPDTETRKRLMRVITPGLQVEAAINVEGARSLPQHRRYYATLRDVAGAIPENMVEEFWRNVIGYLVQAKGIDPDLLHELIKKILGVESIAFCVMGPTEASAFFNEAEALLLTVVPGGAA